MSRLSYPDGMSIEDRTDTHPGRIEEHYCEHPGCNTWGGFGLARTKGEPVRWWCWEHYPYKDPSPVRSGAR